MQKTKLWAVFLMVACTGLTSAAQIMYKFGVKDLRFDIVSLLTNYYLIGGLSLYALGAIFTILAFRGGEVSVLYPIVATSYIWVAMLSVKFLGESMNIYKIVGIASIIAGIIVIGLGSDINGKRHLSTKKVVS